MNYLTKNLNIDNSSASMIWEAQYVDTGEFCGYEENFRDRVKREKIEDVPAFTVEDLIKLLPKWQLSTITDGYSIHVIPNNWDMCIPYPKASGKTLLEVFYRIICILKRKSLI